MMARRHIFNTQAEAFNRRMAVQRKRSYGLTGGGHMAVIIGPTGKAGHLGNHRVALPIAGGHKMVIL